MSCIPVSEITTGMWTDSFFVPGAIIISIPGRSSFVTILMFAVVALPAAAPFARQVSFRPAGEHPGLGLTVVSFDADGCVARIETFATGTRLRPVSATEFSSPLEPLPGLRLFRRIETTTTVEGREVRTASSFDRLRVNEELPPSIFDPKAFF